MILKRKALIVDLDGTLCDNAHRTRYVDGSQPKDWNTFNALSAFDPHNDWCLELVRCFSNNGYKIIFLTARSGTPETRKITEDWLMTHVGPGVDYILVMRSAKDYRPDYVVKQELYNNKIAPEYEVLFAVDDKPAVTNMWKQLGIAALHCGDVL